MTEPPYEIRMTKITTAEDADISEDLRGKADVAESILRMVDGIEGIEIDKPRLFKYIVSKVFDFSDLGDLVSAPLGNSIEETEPGETASAGEEGDGFVEPEGSEPVEALDREIKFRIDEVLSRKGTLEEEDIDNLLRIRV